MKISQSTLLKALQIVHKAIGASIILPVTENYQFTIKGNKLTIAATNMKFYIRTETEVQDGADMSVLINASKLFNLISQLPDQSIDFSFTESRVVIKYAGGKIDLPTENGKDFPTMTEPKGQTMVIKSDILMDGLAKVIPSKEKSRPDRPALECVNLALSPNVATFNAGGAGGLAHFSYDTAHEVTADILIPEHCFGAFDLPKETDVAVIIGKNNMGLYIDKTAILIGLLDDKFPDIVAKLTSDEPITAKVDRDLLLSAINRIKSFTPIGNKMLKLDFSDVLKITAQDHNFEHSAEEEINCEYSGEPITIGTNADNFYNAVKRLSDFTIHLSGEKKPITMRGDGGLIMVMPVHLS